jgi:glutathione S-transferase
MNWEIELTTLPLTSLITLLVGMLMLATGINVGRARVRYGIQAPAVTGNELFERAYRVQMNTLENAALMLPALWLYGGFIGDRGAAITGGAWLLARIWYALAYMASPAKRGPAFGISMAAFAGLWLGGAWGVIRAILH